MHKLQLFLICMLFPLSMLAQHTEQSLIIYRNNDTKLYLPCEKIDSITFLHNEPTTLWVHTPQDPLFIPVADIDSMKVLPLPSFCPDAHHPHAIDLALPSGNKWACCNVGSSAPEDDGGYYAWGEVEEKTDYSWDTYTLAHYDYTYDDYVCDYAGINISGTPNDVAYVKWGKPWRMPSEGAYHELMNNCSCQQIEYRGTKGWIFTGSNGNSVFMPAAGSYIDTSITLKGISTQNWTSTFYLDDYLNQHAYFFSISTFIDSPLYNVVMNDRYNGRTVRAIAK